MIPRLPRERTYDLLAVGELLADFISDEPVASIREAESFTRYTGGSPANLARNLAVLDKTSALVAAVGDDGLGEFLVDELTEAGVETDPVATHPTRPTSSVLIARSAETPDFIHYRQADTAIDRRQLPTRLARDTRIFHTTCVALSTNPARAAILDAADDAAGAASHLSLDANYVRSHWPNAATARRTIQRYCAGTTLVKASMDDVERIFETDEMTPDEAVEELHDWGAWLVCLTMGGDGSLVSWQEGAESARVEAESVDDVHGATGAGDAYWSGFLSAWLDGQKPPACAARGAEIAAAKVRRRGPLDRAAIEQLGD